jgi:hypothetical protein
LGWARARFGGLKVYQMATEIMISAASVQTSYNVGRAFMAGLALVGAGSGAGMVANAPDPTGQVGGVMFMGISAVAGVVGTVILGILKDRKEDRKDRADERKAREDERIERAKVRRKYKILYIKERSAKEKAEELLRDHKERMSNMNRPAQAQNEGPEQ